MKICDGLMIGSVAIVLLNLAGCVAPPATTTTTSVVAAKSAEATKLRRIAVLPFGIKDGIDITPEVETLLTGVLVNDQPFFTVVERNRIKDLLREMKLAESGALDPTTVSKLGKMAGASGVYMGAVTRNSVRDERYKESRFRCDQYEQKRDKKGNPYQGKCLRPVEYTVDCVQRIADFAFNPKLVDVQAGTIKYSKEATGSTQSKACPDHAAGNVAATQLLHDARKLALQSFRQDVAPHTARFVIVVQEAAEGINSTAAREKFVSAIAFAKGNRLDRACEIWDEIVPSEDRSPSLHYNHGVCAEAAGELDIAMARYTKADRLLTKPEKAISEALARVRQLQSGKSKLQQQISN